MQVTVFGSTGGVGSRVIEQLGTAGHTVVAVSRTAADVATSPGVSHFVADVEDADLAPALAGSAAVVWALGARFGQDGPDGPDRIDRAGTIRAVAAAVATGVRRWVHVSSLGADDPASGPPLLLPFLRAKAVSDEAVRASGLDWTVLRPSGLTDEPGTGRVQAAEHLTFPGRPPTLARDDLAAVVVAALTEERTVGRSFDLTAGESPIAAALAALSDAPGR
jgi:uncharacterized protein YbjT (DUF2867 family)